MLKEVFIKSQSDKKTEKNVSTTKHLLSYCDGKHSLLDIAEKIEIPIWKLYELIDELVLQDLISQENRLIFFI